MNTQPCQTCKHYDTNRGAQRKPTGYGKCLVRSENRSLPVMVKATEIVSQCLHFEAKER